MAGAAPRFVGPFLRALWEQAPDVGLLAPQVSRTALREASLLLPGKLAVRGSEPAAAAAEVCRVPVSAAGAGPLAALQLAAAAHAGAHLAYPSEPFERLTLKPVQIALLGLLEDARVEWLAARELPGLRTLWLAYHRANAASGNDFETLMARAARCLLEPGYLDPHPWVHKARHLFFADDEGRRLRLHDPASVRHAASLLGNDIGQMRLQFNARLYEVAPEYRDDNLHLWCEAVHLTRADAGPGTPLEATAHALAREEPGPEERPLARYPEWDRLIGRTRRDWVSVYADCAARFGLSNDPGGVNESLARAMAPAGAQQQLREAIRAHAFVAHRLRRALPAILDARARARPERAHEGDDLDLQALVEARIDQQGGRLPDPRVYLRGRPSRAALSVLILLDASASTARPAGPAGSVGSVRSVRSVGRVGSGPAGPVGSDSAEEPAGVSVLHMARLAALLVARAIEACGQECAVEAFASNGREQVAVHRIKDFDDRCDDQVVIARAAALRSGWSTRLGALVRHAAASLAGRPAQHRIVMLFTDGEPHDIDVHDPRYLIDDLQHAIRDAAQRGVPVVCLDLDASPANERRQILRRVFGAGAYRQVARLSGLAAQAEAAWYAAFRLR